MLWHIKYYFNLFAYNWSGEEVDSYSIRVKIYDYYDNLLEMDEVNPQFTDTDVAMVFGACDVVNPAARDFSTA